MHDWRPELRSAFAAYRQAGVRQVEWVASEHACAACRGLDGQHFPLDLAPRIPLERCGNDECRCQYVALGDLR